MEQVPGSLGHFEPDHAFMDAAFELSITTGIAGAELVYTLDGGEPSETDDPAALAYEGPLAVSTTTVVRAVAVHDGEALGAVASRTWVFPEQVAAQEPPEGWPERWSEDFGIGAYNEAHYNHSWIHWDSTQRERPDAHFTSAWIGGKTRTGM